MQPDRAIHAAFRCAFNGLGGPLAATLAGKRVVGSGRLHVGPAAPFRL
jgi:hypothetical protein